MPQIFGKFDHMRFRDLRKHLDSRAEKTEELFQRRFVGELFPNRGGQRPIRMTGIRFPDLRYGQGTDLRGHLEQKDGEKEEKQEEKVGDAEDVGAMLDRDNQLRLALQFVRTLPVVKALQN